MSKIEAVTFSHRGEVIIEINERSSLQDIEVPLSDSKKKELSKIDKDIEVARAKKREADARLEYLRLKRDYVEMLGVESFWQKTMFIDHVLPEHLYFKVRDLRTEFFKEHEQIGAEMREAQERFSEAHQEVKRLTQKKIAT